MASDTSSHTLSISICEQIRRVCDHRWDKSINFPEPFRYRKSGNSMRIMRVAFEDGIVKVKMSGNVNESSALRWTAKYCVRQINGIDIESDSKICTSPGNALHLNDKGTLPFAGEANGFEIANNWTNRCVGIKNGVYGRECVTRLAQHQCRLSTSIDSIGSVFHAMEINCESADVY